MARLLSSTALQRFRLALISSSSLCCFSTSSRHAVVAQVARAEGDISAVFPSLSGKKPEPLDARFGQLKRELIKDPAKLEASWRRLITALKAEVRHIQSKDFCIPECSLEQLSASELESGTSKAPASYVEGVGRYGVTVIKGVIPQEQALQWKEDVREYIKQNPQMKAFPAARPAVFEAYWSKPQVQARSHPNMLATQRFLNGLWHSSIPDALISTQIPVTYADRVRIREPGDTGFALGPHVDGGSIEKWEDPAFRKVYRRILEGRWEEHDSWDLSHRVNATMDLYNGAGTCSVMRTFQGWLAMSNTGPGEGTLMVNPMLIHATAYIHLRPFFKPSPTDPENLDAWEFDHDFAPDFPACVPGTAQELNLRTHPHLELDKTMIHIPKVEPGDYVAWQCDTIHAVDAVHKGSSDSSVMYIPTAPLCEVNANYMVTQRDSFLQRTPPRDFPGGNGEKNFSGTATPEDTTCNAGLQALGLGSVGWKVRDDMPPGEKTIIESSNRLLGWA